jgi:hypothetical protein
VRVTDRMLKDRAEDLAALLGERLGVAV